MNGYNFTERVRAVLAGARDEASELRHEYVGTEHILLALMREDSSVAGDVIESLGVRREDATARIGEMVRPGSQPGDRSPHDIPYTSRAKKALELAMAEARLLNHSYVGTQHLLLGLIREGSGVAAQVIASFGITIDAARVRVLEILETGRQDDDGFQRKMAPGAAMARTSTPTRMVGYAKPPAGTAWMAASILEVLTHEPGIAHVFAAQGIDVGTLIAALRAQAFRSPPGDAPGSSAGDSPPASPPAA